MAPVYISKNLETVAGQEKIRDDMSLGYYANAYGFGEYLIKNMPLFTLWTARQMLTDPTVKFALVIRNAAVSAARVKIESEKDETWEFVNDQWENLWGKHQNKLMRAKENGYGAYQIMYKEEETSGNLVIEGCKEFAPQDVRAIRLFGQPGGFRLHNRNLVKSDKKREHTTRYLKFPRALWLSYDARYESMYGRSVMRNAYLPWFEKWMNHGAKKSQQMRMIKDAYPQLIGWYDQNEKIRLPNGDIVTAQNVMRSLLANLFTSGTATLPSNMNDQNSRKWDITRLPDAGDPSRMFRWTEELNEDIYRGMSVPSEVISAASSGSGYSGRSIPMAVFLQSCQQEFNDYLAAIDDQVIRPLVRMNFGHDDYQMRPLSLLQTFTALMSEDMGGDTLSTGDEAATFTNAANYNPESKLAEPGQIEKRGDASVLGETSKGTVTTQDKQRKLKQMSEDNNIDETAELIIGKSVKDLAEDLRKIAKRYPAYDLRVHDEMKMSIARYSDEIAEKLAAMTFSSYVEGVETADSLVSSFAHGAGWFLGAESNHTLAAAAEIFPQGLEITGRVLRNLSVSPVSAGRNYMETAQMVREGAFAMTGGYTEATLDKVKSILTATVSSGGDANEFAVKVVDAIESGEVPLSEPFLRTVYRTNVHMAYNNGLDEAMQGHEAAFPYRKYRATDDERVRPEHLALETNGLQGKSGKTAYYEATSGAWQAFRPPWDYNCRCAQTPITVREAAREGVLHAKAWWKAAEAIATERGGKPEFYLRETKPPASSQVWPTLNGVRIEPNPAFIRTP